MRSQESNLRTQRGPLGDQFLRNGGRLLLAPKPKTNSLARLGEKQTAGFTRVLTEPPQRKIDPPLPVHEFLRQRQRMLLASSYAHDAQMPITMAAFSKSYSSNQQEMV